MFLNGVVAGVFMGMAVMYYWICLMRHRRKVRYQMAEDEATLLHVSKAAAMEKLTGVLPRWINFNEYEEAEWFNGCLEELWPFVNKAVQDTIVEVVEPMMQQYKPAVVASMEFTRSDLGSNAPRIRGVKVHSLSTNQVVMDLDLTWQGNCKFKLTIKMATLATVVPQIQDLSFNGTLRLILELTGKVPVVAAYVAAINRRAAPPDYDLTYSLTGAGLGTVPGLPAMIDGIIRSSIDDTMLWPKRILGALLDDYDVKHLEFLYDGAIVVTVVKAEGLKNQETIGKSDPRVVVYLNKTRKAATKVINNNLNPVWKDEVFEIPVDDVHTATLYLEVEDDDTLSFSNMGYASLPVEDVWKKGEESTWTLPIYNSLSSALRDNVQRGHLTIKTIYRNYLDEEERERVTKEEHERVLNGLMNQLDKALGPEEAAAAKAKAVASSTERQQNIDLWQGVGKAAKKLIGLQRGGLEGSEEEGEGGDVLGEGMSKDEKVAAAAAIFKTAARSLSSKIDPAKAEAAVLEAAAAEPAEGGSFVGLVNKAAERAAATMPMDKDAAINPEDVANEVVRAVEQEAGESAALSSASKEKGGSKHRVSGFLKGIKQGLKGSKRKGEE